MRIFFDYPLATEENMKAVQAAIDAGKDYDELSEIFNENALWDCIAVLSGNQDTAWALLEQMNGHEQRELEEWQYEMMENHIKKCQILQSVVTAEEGAEVAIQIGNKVVLIHDFTEGGWDYCLTDWNGNELDAGGVYGDYDTPLGEAVRTILEDYSLSIDDNWFFLPFRSLLEES